MGIPAGFGERLKFERKRLKLTQTELAQIGGVGRLAQSQYESEISAPTTRYLSEISAAGVDLAYLILGVQQETQGLTAYQQKLVEDKTFEWIQRYAEKRADGRLRVEEWKILYEVFRSFLVQIELKKLPVDLDPETLLLHQNIITSK